MVTIFEQCAGFVEQQLELYGDELAIDRQALILVNKREEPNEPEGWKHSTSLAELERSINTCQRCPLGKSRHKFVFGQGKFDADLFLVGEAPGADEDRIGFPFVGRAGELLNKILSSVHWQREAVYIGNILKCRPPQNRDPLLEEIMTCMPYLEKQIKLVQPKVILCLGRIAAHVLLETTDSLSALRGRWHRREAIDIYVTYHPAALLRNPSLKKEVWQDIQAVRQRLMDETQI